jgi:hypothetical protein
MTLIRSQNGGWINLDLVAEIVPRDLPGEPDRGYACIDADGERIGDVLGEPILGDLLPNTRNVELLMFWDDGSFTNYPVLGWRIEGEYSTPIIAESGVENGIYCLQQTLSDGSANFIFPEDMTFTERQSALDYGAERAKAAVELREKLRQRLAEKAARSKAG